MRTILMPNTKPSTNSGKDGNTSTTGNKCKPIEDFVSLSSVTLPRREKKIKDKAASSAQQTWKEFEEPAISIIAKKALMINPKTVPEETKPPQESGAESDTRTPQESGIESDNNKVRSDKKRDLRGICEKAHKQLEISEITPLGTCEECFKKGKKKSKKTREKKSKITSADYLQGGIF